MGWRFTRIMLKHYANVIDELIDEPPRIPTEEQIVSARDVGDDKPAEG